MGFNIAGLVINQNYNKEISELSYDLEIGIEVIKEITFEEASKNWLEGDTFNVYFGNKGTMIFFPHEVAINEYASTSSASMCYAYSATSMAFLMHYRDSKGNVRSIMEVEEDRMTDIGEKLEIEEKYDSTDGLIFALMDELMEENWHGIEMESKALNCRIISLSQMEAKEKQIKTSIEKVISMPETKVNAQKVKIEKVVPQKKWWQFWN